MKILIMGGTGVMGFPLTSILATNSENEVYCLCHRKRDIQNVRFLVGDFSDEKIRDEIRTQDWDCIVDLLWHNEKKFSYTLDFLAPITKHYIFASTGGGIR